MTALLIVTIVLLSLGFLVQLLGVTMDKSPRGEGLAVGVLSLPGTVLAIVACAICLGYV